MSTLIPLTHYDVTLYYLDATSDLIPDELFLSSEVKVKNQQRRGIENASLYKYRINNIITLSWH